MEALISFSLGTAVAFAATGCGRWLLLRIGCAPLHPAGALATSLALGSIALSHLFLALGMLGVIDRRVYAAILAVTFSLGLRGARLLWLDWRDARLEIGEPRPLAPVLLFVLAAAVLLAAVSALAPVSDWDTRSYHLGGPQRYLRDGQVRFYPDDVSFSFYNGQSMLNLWLLALGSDVAGQVLSWWFTVALLAMLYAITVRLFGAGPALFAAALAATFPFVAERSIQASPDIAAALLTLTPILLLAAGTPRTTSRSAVLIGILAGGAIAFRMTSALTLLPIGLLCLAWWTVRDALRTTAVLRLGATAAVACALCVLPWAARNYLWTGDPAYPFLRAIFGGSLWTEASARHGWGQLDPGSALSLARLRVQAGVLLTSIEFSPLVFALAPFAPLFHRRRAESALLLATVGAATLLGLAFSDYTRYYAASMLLGAVLAGHVAVALLAWPRRFRRAFLTLSLAVLGVGLAASVLWHLQFARAALGLVARDAFLESRSAFYADYQWMNRHLPGDAVLVVLARESYYLDRRALRFCLGLTAHLDPFDLETYADPTQFLRELRKAGVTHLFVPDPDAEATRLYWDVRFMGEHGRDLFRGLIEHHARLIRQHPASVIGGRLAGTREVATFLYELLEASSGPPSDVTSRDHAVLGAQRYALETTLEAPQRTEPPRKEE